MKEFIYNIVLPISAALISITLVILMAYLVFFIIKGLIKEQ